MLGPYITSRGTRVIEMPANAGLTKVETYVQQGKQYIGQNVKNIYILGYLGSPEGSYVHRLGLSSFPAILSPISMCMSNKEEI